MPNVCQVKKNTLSSVLESVSGCLGWESNPYGRFGPRDFRTTMAFATISVCGLDYSFTVGLSPLGVPCLVSAPSSFQRLGSRLPSALPGKVSLNLRHSTSLFSESALNFCRLDIRITVGGCFCVELATKTGEKQKNNATLTKIMAWKAYFMSRRQGHGPAPVIRMSKSSHKSLVSTIPPPRQNVGMQRYNFFLNCVLDV